MADSTQNRWLRTLAELLEAGEPGHPAIVVPGGPKASYAELKSQVESMASALREAGVRPGEVVALVLGNGLPFVVAFLAVARAGAVAAPLNPAYTADELRFFMVDAGARVVVLSPDPHPAGEVAASLALPCLEASLANDGVVLLSRGGKLLDFGRDVEPPAPEMAALLLHTSGTTSRPRGVPLTHANLVASVANMLPTYHLTREDVALAVMPLFHVHGLIGVLLSTLAAGGTTVVPPRFSASTFWQVAADHGATWYSAVPTIHQILLSRADADEAPSGTFRLIRSCSAALAPALLAQLESRFGAPVLEAYGMTEAAHQMTSNPPPPGERRPGTVGPGTGVQIAIMDEAGTLLPAGQQGEVVVQGPNVMKGYRNDPGANADAFVGPWLRTGDLGLLEPDGYLQLNGRLKEIINRGGEKISPSEVDAVLTQHPAVAEAVCFGVADAKYGEEVHAAVVLKVAASQQELQRFCLDHLAEFKVPKVVHFLEELPRTATGKVQRRQVAAHVAEGPPATTPGRG